MKTTDFSFDLPEELIAQYPSDSRADDRLLVINRVTGEYSDKKFTDFPSLLNKGDVLVLNDTRVRKARVYAQNENGGKVECLFLHPSSVTNGWNVITNRVKRRHIGEVLSFQNAKAVIESIHDGICTIKFDSPIDESFFDKEGHVPLPPYIKREDEFSDESRYQTIYSKNLGSCASPTSGLHFTQSILDEIQNKGVIITYVTLHVGMGTFMPLRESNIEDHKMHSEYFNISKETANIINKAKSEGRKIVASGTTVVRTLESMWNSDTKSLDDGSGETDIFIYPGFKFNVIDKLLTNFHTPESTLFALVCAFSSMGNAKRAYKHAVESKYRFFSYGDATFFY